MNKSKWLSLGLSKGWIASYCATHDRYMTNEELEEEEPCVAIFRLVQEKTNENN